VGLKNVKDIEVQTEEAGMIIPTDEIWLYKMFKLERMSTLSGFAFQKPTSLLFGFPYNSYNSLSY